MKNIFRQVKVVAAILLCCIAVSGCGGGSGSSSGSRKATAKVTMNGLVSTGSVGSLSVTISLPYGVTVPLSAGLTTASDQATINKLNSVVQLVSSTGVNFNMLLAGVTYIPAEPTSNGSIKIAYLKADGFNPNFDSLLLQLDVTTGYSPSPFDFILDPFTIATFTPDNPATPGIDETSISAETPVPNIQYTVEII